MTWSALAHATTYSVYESTTTVGGTYTSVATGVTTTWWTSGTLTAGTNYWFEILAIVGTNCSGTKSSATGESTIKQQQPILRPALDRRRRDRPWDGARPRPGVRWHHSGRFRLQRAKDVAS